MKYLTFFFVLFLTAGLSTATQAQADAISKYFSKYMDDERFTVVYISGKMFEMFKKMDIDLDDEEAEAILSVVKNMKGLRILINEDGGQAFYEEALSIINKNEYEVLMTVREGKKENVQFLVKESGDNVIDELLLLVGGEDEEFVLMSFVGKIDLNEVSKLQKAFDKEDDDDKEDRN